VEWREPVADGELKLAAGRQEMEIGSSRLISASPGLNVKRSFDGASVSYRRASWVIAAGAASAGAFDDRPDSGQQFCGVAAPIRAWAIASETGYRWTSVRWRPWVSVRSDVASGDKDAADRRLQSFNPLFPGNSYSGAVGLLGPTNLTDFTPALTLFPHRALVVGVELLAHLDGQWRLCDRPAGPRAGAGRVGTLHRDEPRRAGRVACDAASWRCRAPSPGFCRVAFWPILSWRAGSASTRPRPDTASDSIRP
jgi:hypothetical protein